MPILKLIKIPAKTKHFNQNQRAWIVNYSGNMAAEVVGKFRGKHGYVKAWVKWSEQSLPIIAEVDVTEAFYEMIIGRANKKPAE